MTTRTYRALLWTIGFTACSGIAHLANSAEPPNGDRRLSVTRGLSVWLDASRVASKENTGTQPTHVDAVALSDWKDLSGNHRDFVQTSGNEQPKLMRIGEDWIVRFDGESDYMRSLGGTSSVQAVTLFIVAAPHANPGDFRGLFATNAPQQRDYESGFTLDLGPGPTRRFNQLNVEGKGFGGARNLCKGDYPFGTLHVLESSFNPTDKTVRLVIDGAAQETRPFAATAISMAELTLGGRFYTNGPGDHQIRGPVSSDIAELLVYDRILTDQETGEVRKYLESKYQRLSKELPNHLPKQSGKPLVKAEDPPLIQMLVPGFEVREIPLSLTNVNNVRFRDDGKLMTLGYNGDIHLLSDTDGDGIEDQASVFWKNEGSLRGPIGLVLTPPNYSHGRGAILPSKGKVSLIVDVDGDDKADKEEVIAQGWHEITQSVDAVGIAMDKDGSIYFGLGTENYANAYLTDNNGIAAYNLRGERGTVQRISPDFKERTTVCTGIRFPIAFAFNRQGDLFCSEQEGATWLANGNPFDELLHVQPNRHYGFPPRHPKHNPTVIDEPSTFDYSPQHQSTCGMVFNYPVNGGPTFGPADWKGDAIVCGESRGKIWRTQLVKTDAGYVASSQLLACLQMLTIDACVAPNGDLVVACHSGPPDWGTGPAGIGKLFRIQMKEPERARPLVAWPESPNEIRIAFDKPVDPLQFRELKDKVKVEYGKYVRAGDRFENLVPPYAVVHQQSTAPRFELPVAGVSITPDLRTMILSTGAMKQNAYYAVTIPTAGSSTEATPDLRQHHEMDIDFSLNGVQGRWKPDQGTEWSGWLPHIDTKVAREWTASSESHASLWSELDEAGELKLQTKLDLHHMLRPKIQPGASIDYTWPPETVTVAWTCDRPFRIQHGDQSIVASQKGSGTLYQATLPVSGDSEDLQSLTLVLRKPSGSMPAIHMSYITNEDERARPFPLNRFFVPWIQEQKDAPESEQAKPELTGNWGKGRQVFNSEAAGCFKCHAMQGVGPRIGPDLSNLIFRDYDSVMRDIVNPSFAINPDHIGHLVMLDDGEVLTGVLRTERGELILGDAKGKDTLLSRDRITEMKPSKESVMPKGLTEKLTTEQLQDLMKYLLSPPPHMPFDSPLTAPPIRSMAEVSQALANSVNEPKSHKPLNMVLVSGTKDHGPGEHDYPAWQVQWGQLLSAQGDTVSMAWDFPSEEQLGKADVLIFFQKGAWNDARAKGMDAFFARGGGAVYIHWAVNGDEQVASFSKRIGLASRGGSISYRHGPLELKMPESKHPILRNFKSLQLYDESYWALTGDLSNVQVLAWSDEEGTPRPQMWTYEPDKGRVFVSIPGHYSWTFDDPLFRILLLRGIAWSAKEPIDRFNELVPLGARMSR